MLFLSSNSSLVETNSLHQRHANSPNTPHRRLSVASVVQPDSLGTVLPTDQVTLKRHLGLFSGVCFIIGTIIGIFLNSVVGGFSIDFCRW